MNLTVGTFVRSRDDDADDDLSLAPRHQHHCSRGDTVIDPIVYANSNSLLLLLSGRYRGGIWKKGRWHEYLCVRQRFRIRSAGGLVVPLIVSLERAETCFFGKRVSAGTVRVFPSHGYLHSEHSKKMRN